MKDSLDISIVVPIYNEAGNILPLDVEIKSVLKKMNWAYEVIYVNDGSTDTSLEELKSLKHVTVIDLNRNYGQATALDAGFKAAEGETIVSLDGDGQNDPKDIPRLVSMLQSGHYDVVAGYRKSRADKPSVRIMTRIGRSLRHALIADSVSDSGCTLRAYKKEAVKSLDIGGDMHRYILALLRWKGFRIGEVVVNDRPRLHGESKYNTSKAIHGTIDLVYVWFINKYSQRPLHLFGYFSFTAFFLGAISFLFTLYDKLFLGLSLNRDGWFFLTFFFLLAAILLFSFGVIIDLLIRIQLGVSLNEKRYHIRDIFRT